MNANGHVEISFSGTQLQCKCPTLRYFSSIWSNNMKTDYTQLHKYVSTNTTLHLYEWLMRTVFRYQHFILLLYNCKTINPALQTVFIIQPKTNDASF